MSIITHNLSAMNGNRQLNITTNNLKKSSEKLASGYKINRAADDAAGLSISEKMRAQIRGLDRGAQNLQDGISYVQVADGALNEVHSMLQRFNELAVQATNGTNSESDREALDAEAQALKTEMERIFTTTKFNEQQIWPETGISNAPTVVGYTPVQAVKITTPSSQKNIVNNSNFNKFPVHSSSYKILADQQGVSLAWTDYDGQAHETLKVSWNVLEENNYSFQIADYFDPADTNPNIPNDTGLFDANDNPLFDFTVSFSVVDCATVDNIIGAINNTTMSSYLYVTGAIQFENADGTKKNAPDVSASVSLSSNAMYASRTYANANAGETGFDYDQTSDSFAQPSSMSGNMTAGPDIPNVSTPETNKQNWEFSFYIEGIGNVTATSKNIQYSSSDRSSDTENIWWHYYTNDKGEIKQSGNSYPKTTLDGTLSSIIESLTGNFNQGDKSSPGLLEHIPNSLKGTHTYFANITLNFDLTSAQAYTYANKTSQSVGSMSLSIKIYSDDTIDTVLSRISNALNDTTVLDISTNYVSNYSTAYRSSAKNSDADQPVYENHFSFNPVNVSIHGGPAVNDKTNITYQCLRVEALKIHNTNLLTEDTAFDAIAEVGDAIEIISRERSLFGAYQNRLEHSLSVNKNTSENTSAAESRIRDTDIATEVVKNSKENILLQVSQSILAQANSAPNGVLTLLK